MPIEFTAFTVTTYVNPGSIYKNNNILVKQLLVYSEAISEVVYISPYLQVLSSWYPSHSVSSHSHHSVRTAPLWILSGLKIIIIGERVT